MASLCKVRNILECGNNVRCPTEADDTTRKIVKCDTQKKIER